METFQRLVQPLRSRKLVECTVQAALGPWMYDSAGSRPGRISTGVRRGARLPRTRSQDCPDRVAADCMGRGHGGEISGKKIKTTETLHWRRSRLLRSPVFRRKVMNLPSEARRCIVLRGCRLGSLGRATIMSATRRSWDFGEVSTPIRTSSPACPPDWWSHGTFGVDELEDRIEDEPPGSRGIWKCDVEFECEIEAIAGALEPDRGKRCS